LGTDKSFKDNWFVQTCFRTVCNHRGDEQLDEKVSSFDQPDKMALGLMLNLYLADRNFKKTEEILKLLLETAGGLSAANKLINNFVREGK